MRRGTPAQAAAFLARKEEEAESQAAEQAATAASTSKKTTAAKGKSPAKKAAVKAPSTAKKSASPSKKKSPSPKKSAAYKTGMGRSTRATSVAAAKEVPVAASATKKVKEVLQKRGPLGTDDNDDDPTQPTEEMLETFDQRSLTNMDKFMIRAIMAMEEEDYTRLTNDGHHVAHSEWIADREGEVLDCHTKIYWRFLDLWARCNEGVYPGDAFTFGSPGRPSGRKTTRSGSKPPPKGRSARQVSATSTTTTTLPSPRSQMAAAMSRPFRAESSKSPQRSHGHVLSDQTAGPSRISKENLARSTRGATTRALPGDVAHIFSPSREDKGTLLSFEKAAYDALMSGKPVPPLPRNLQVPKAVAYIAQERGRSRAVQQLELDEDVHMTNPEEGVVPDPIRRSPSPGKQRAGSLPPSSPAKPLSRVRSHSPGKHPAVVEPTTSSPPKPNIVRRKDPNRGRLISSQNPEKIEVKRGRKLEVEDNPFFESMPAPEVWHRRMPSVFPFGETPFMARVVSDQINADLSRNFQDHDDDEDEDDDATPPTEDPSFLSRTLSSVAKLVGSPTKATSNAAAAAAEESAREKWTSMWDLPEVDEALHHRIKSAAHLFQSAHDPHHHQQKKRAAMGQHHHDHAPQKRARGPRRGEGAMFV